MPTDTIEEQLKQLEQEAARLQQRKAELEAERKRQEELDQKLEDVVKQSGYESPRELVRALIAKYGIRLGGRPSAARPAEGARTRRKRTRITGELRDQVKNAVNNGSSMNAASKSFGISYAVVAKIMKGHYDNA